MADNVELKLDLSTRKRRKRRKTHHVPDNDGTGYPYTILLDRIYRQMKRDGIGAQKTVRLKAVYPIVRMTNQKTIWINFANTCHKFQRPCDHVFSFFSQELCATTSLDSKMRMHLRGRFPPPRLANGLKKYAKQFILCKNCQGYNTALVKDHATRLYFIYCEECLAKKSVASLK